MDADKLSEEIKSLEVATFKEIAPFIKNRRKRFRKAESQAPFWTATLLAKWSKQILELPYAIDFLLDYFRQPDANLSFLQAAAAANSRLIERAVKLSKAYELEEHWKSMECLKSHENTRLKLLYKELTYIRRLNQHWEEQGKFYEGVIAALDYEDILIHLIACFERFKRSEETIRNQSLITSYELHYCRVLNHILNIKREAQPDEAISNKYELSDFRQKAADVMPPLNPVKGLIQGKYLPNELITPEKKLIREVIDFYFRYLSMKYQIEKYLCGYADFELIDVLEAELKTNENFAIHWRNDKKSIFQEVLAMNKALDKPELQAYLKQGHELYEKQVAFSMQAADESWKYACLPPSVGAEGKEKIETHKLFELLISLSNYLMPDGRVVILQEGSNPPQQVAIAKRNKPKQFEQLFGNDYIYSIGADEFMKNIAQYFDWDLPEVQHILDFLTINLNDSNAYLSKEIDVLSRPLIQIGSQYIWLSSLMKDRRWDNLLHRRIAKEYMHNHNDQSALMEERIAQSFRDAGFKALTGWKYNQGKEGEGEIDILAFRDKTLFVLELKTSFLEEDLLAYNKYRELRFDYKASDQLSSHLEYIENDFEAIKGIPDLSIDCDLEAINIQPLIISNIFEFDNQLINEQYQKVSLFELQVILHNDLYQALHTPTDSYSVDNIPDQPIAAIFQRFNQNNPQFKRVQAKAKDKASCNLWSNPYYCTPEDLITAIRERVVWQGLDEMMEFKSGERIDVSGN